MMGKKYSRRSRKISPWIILSLVIIIGGSIAIVTTVQNSEARFATTHKTVQSTSTANILKTPLPTMIDDTPTLSATPAPLFDEDFVDNTKGWPITDSSDYTRTLDNNELTLAVTNHKILTETVPASTTFGDCTINIDFTLLKADALDSVGIYVRGDSLLFHDYRIDIFGDNTVALSKEYLDLEKKPQTLQFEKTPRIPALTSIGKLNTLTVIMKGPYVMVQINGTTVKTLVDSDYMRGQIALFVDNGPTSDGVMATFSHVQITGEPDQLPGLPMSSTATAIAN
jgi:hypothetical protein